MTTHQHRPCPADFADSIGAHHWRQEAYYRGRVEYCAAVARRAIVNGQEATARTFTKAACYSARWMEHHRIA